MKTEGSSNWSSIDQVLDSFNNVSLFGNNSEQEDLYRPPTPPKYRISPSQLELLGIDPGILSPRPVPASVQRGRGRIINNPAYDTPRDRDLALKNFIRSTKTTTCCNADIEAYFNTNCIESDDTSYKSKKGKETEIKSPDQIPVNSNLSAEACGWYPAGNPHLNPEEISQRLSNLRDSKFSPISSKKTTENNHSISKKNESDYHIGFYFKTSDSESDEDCYKSDTKSETISTFSSTPSSSKSPLLDKSIPNPEPISVDINCEVPQLSSSENNVNTKSSNLIKNNIPKHKRVIKNALLSSLMNQSKPQTLLKPVDFTLSSGFKPIDVAESPCNNYDYLTDSSISDETKELIKSLTSPSVSSSSSPASNQSDSTSSNSVLPNVAKQVKIRPPKPPSYFEYKYKEHDFPPLS